MATCKCSLAILEPRLHQNQPHFSSHNVNASILKKNIKISTPICLRLSASANFKKSKFIPSAALATDDEKSKVDQESNGSILNKTENGSLKESNQNGNGGLHSQLSSELQSLPRRTPAELRVERATQAIELLQSFSQFFTSDGAGPRWFCPIDAKPPFGEVGCAPPPLPRLFFLPGIDGTGLGLVLQHGYLARLFEVTCLHIPQSDSTPFTGLVELVEKELLEEHRTNPNRALYILGESFGGILAFAVAARNPNLPLQLVIINPATSFERTQLAPLLPLFRIVPSSLYQVIPILLSTTIADPLRISSVGTDDISSPIGKIQKQAENLKTMLFQLPTLNNIMPLETLRWKLELLSSGCSYTEPLLSTVQYPVLLITSGNDRMLPSKEEGKRLKKILPNCSVKEYPDSSHSLLLEDEVNIASIIKGRGMYQRFSKKMNPYVEGFIPPTAEEIEKGNALTQTIKQLCSPIFFSTDQTGKIALGLSSLPMNQRPLLFIGNHQTFAPDLSILIERVLNETGVLMRGLTHPVALGNMGTESGESPMSELFRTFGAVPVSAGNMYRLLANGDAVLLFPGGAREAYRRKGEEYKLIWPDRSEFVRMAVRHNAIIIPFSAIGVDDGLEILLDTNDIKNIPIIGERYREAVQNFPQVRDMGTGNDEQLFIAPLAVPKAIRRLYFLFGKPIETSEFKDSMDDKEAMQELYDEVKSNVQGGLDYLLKKREEDPYKDLIPRLIYESSWDWKRQAPTFDP